MTTGEFLLYTTEDGVAKLEVRLVDETVWLSQKQMAELFQKDVRTVSEHIRNVFEEGELAPDPTVRNFRTVQTEGQRQVERDVVHYNLDVIISSATSGRARRCSGVRCWTSTPPASTTTRARKPPSASSLRCRTRCALEQVERKLEDKGRGKKK